MRDLRAELSRLILAGLKGRSLEQVFVELRRLFAGQGESLCSQTFYDWAGGLAFPSTRKRQGLLADVIGGEHGEAIRKLQSPAFRGYRRAKVKEKAMTIKHTHKEPQKFPVVCEQQDDGRWFRYGKIVCSVCRSNFELHRRSGSMEDEEYFRKEGWVVGHSREHDVCPHCAAGRKVVKMSDHKKPVEPPAVEAMSKRDRRAVLLYIQDHWDEDLERYQPGWSDVKIASETGKPVAAVKEVREAEFGGVGDDPGVAAYIASVMEMKEEMDGLHKDFEEMSTTILSREKANRLLFEKYKDKHNKLHARVHQQVQMAERLQPPFPKAG